MAKKLEIIPTIKEGVSIALVNYLSVICVVVLYVLTIWIPYLNVGTTIAVSALPAEMAKGSVINPLFIFDGKYRRNMGEFFILTALMVGAILVGFLFGIIPGIVIGYAWYIAVILFVDKDMSAMDALHESNKLTYGNKARIFWIEMLLAAILAVVVAVIGFLFGFSENELLIGVGAFVNALLSIFYVPAMVGVQAAIYKALTTPEEENPAPAPENPVEEVK